MSRPSIQPFKTSCNLNDEYRKEYPVGRHPRMPPPLQSSGVIACGNDRSDEGIAPYDCTRAS